MNNRTTTCVAAVTLAIAVTLGAAAPAAAAPVLSMTTAVKEATPSATSDVQYRRRGRYYRNDGGAVALGILGAVAGAAIYSQNQGYYQPQGYYYGGGPQYGYGSGYGYGPGPGYYGAQNYGQRNFY